MPSMQATQDVIDLTDNGVVISQSGENGLRQIVTEGAAELPLLTLDPVYGECVQDGTPTPDMPFLIHSVRNPNRHKEDWTFSASHQNGTVTTTLMETGGYKEGRAYKLECTANTSGWSYSQSHPDDGLRHAIADLSPGEKVTITWKTKGDLNIPTSFTGVMNGNSLKNMLNMKYSKTIGITEDGWTIRKAVGVRNTEAIDQQTLYFSKPSNVNVGDIGYVCDIQVIFGESEIVDYVSPGNELGIVSTLPNGERTVNYLDLTDPKTGEPIELYGLNDTYRDILSINASGHAIVEKRCEKIILDGINIKIVRRWEYSQTDQNFYNYGLSDSDHSAYYSPKDEIVGFILSDQFTGGYGWGVNNYRAYTYRDDYHFRINGDFGTIDEANTYFASHPVTFIYPLMESAWYTIDLGYVNLPVVSDGSIVYVAAEVQPVIGGSWWTVAGTELAKYEKLQDADISKSKQVDQQFEAVADSLRSQITNLGIDVDSRWDLYDETDKVQLLDLYNWLNGRDEKGNTNRSLLKAAIEFKSNADSVGWDFNVITDLIDDTINPSKGIMRLAVILSARYGYSYTSRLKPSTGMPDIIDKSYTSGVPSSVGTTYPYVWIEYTYGVNNTSTSERFIRYDCFPTSGYASSSPKYVGDPVIVIGKLGDPMKLYLSKDSLDFAYDNQRACYIALDPDGNSKLYVTQSVVLNDMFLGRWRWTVRDSGNMTLTWAEV